MGELVNFIGTYLSQCGKVAGLAGNMEQKDRIEVGLAPTTVVNLPSKHILNKHDQNYVYVVVVQTEY